MNLSHLTRIRCKSLSIFILILFTLTMLFATGCMPKGQSQREAKFEDNTYQIALNKENLNVHFIDVGQGDAILLQAPNLNILIDGGDRDSQVTKYLKAQGIKQLDMVVGTHPHADHIGGLIEVLKDFKVKEVLDPGVVTTSKTFEQYLTLIDEKNIAFTEARAGLSRDLGNGMSLRVLHPTNPSKNNLNAASIVIKLSYGEIDFLFTGDALKSSEQEMLANQAAYLRNEILKVSHHGSSSSTLTKFLKAVKPETAVIMVGAENMYGHPHEETLNKLNKAGVNLYRTDLQGTIIISTDGQSYEVQTNKD